MAKRRHLTRTELATPLGVELVALCQRITAQGRLTELGIRELIRWLRTNRKSDIPAVEVLTETVSRVVADRALSRAELIELYEAILRVLPPALRKIAVKLRKERDHQEYERELEKSGVVLITDCNGKKHELHRLIDRVEYGEKTIEGLAATLGSEVAATVEQHVSARERVLTGYVVKVTPGGAWFFRLVQGGDCCLPIHGVRVISGSPPGPLTIGIPPSLAAGVDRQLANGISVSSSTSEVAERLNVSVDTVRQWIRNGELAAGTESDGSAAFEYRVSEDELNRFASRFRGEKIQLPLQSPISGTATKNSP